MSTGIGAAAEARVALWTPRWGKYVDETFTVRWRSPRWWANVGVMDESPIPFAHQSGDTASALVGRTSEKAP
jgi:hypothetical protein